MKRVLVVFSVALGLTVLSCQTTKESKRLVTPKSPDTMVATQGHQVEVEKTKNDFCRKVNNRFGNYHWNKIVCNPDRWRVYGLSSKGNPLFYQEFGFGNGPDVPVNLFLCGVHGDETSGIYLCFHLARHIIFDNRKAGKNFRLVLAPIVNPDGFLAGTRTNARGVDPNRNLPTKDWNRRALKVWAKYKKDPRKFPGKKAGSEIESRFQTYLVNKYQPDKVVSVHAPYGFLDYDGPGDRKYYNLVRFEQRAKFLALNMEANSKKFLKVVDFRFFPGSLGNYAGNERKIPTYTLELPSTDAAKAEFYWSKLSFALVRALSYRVYDGKKGNPFFRVRNMLKKSERGTASK